MNKKTSKAKHLLLEAAFRSLKINRTTVALTRLQLTKRHLKHNRLTKVIIAVTNKKSNKILVCSNISQMPKSRNPAVVGVGRLF